MTSRIIWIFCIMGATASEGPPEMPMPVRYEETATYRWLNKEVLKSRLLDDMEDLGTWTLENSGEAKGRMELTTERSIDGSHSLRLRSNTVGENPGPTKGRPFGGASVVRRFDGEDWTSHNRVSLWIYPSLPGFHAITVQLLLRNEGPPSGDQRERGYVLLRNNSWNHVVWEIPDVPREKVTGLQLTYRLQGNEPGATGTVTFDFDHLELQRVDADHHEGWNVAPGSIAFSHTGYQTGAPKTAIASDLRAGEFQLVSQDTGLTVLTKPVETVNTPIGRFQVMDFSEVHEPGTYHIRAGNTSTRPFRIGPAVWKRTIWKAINFFYCERCGERIPGIHDVCHRDWQAVHRGRRIIINGGWHDAGDLSQGLVNTAEAVYAMFSLAERLQSTGEDPKLCRRLIEEAKWGLDWVLKTSFRDGYRLTWATMDFWTNGILGNVDDVAFDAQNGPMENYVAAAAEAIAYRVLRPGDPDLADYCLKMAREDWSFAAAGPEGPQRRGNPLETASYGVLASVELLKATGEKKYEQKAIELAKVVVDSQQKVFLPGLDAPITGFFYSSPSKEKLSHYEHRSHEQAPVVALAELCRVLPDHQEWMRWYSAVALHSEYFQKRMATYTAPYGVLPNSVYRLDESLAVPEKERGDYRQQILNGFKVGEDYYLRVFPVQTRRNFRGTHGTVLSQTKALAAAAHLRRKPELAGLCQQQLYWIVGRNPFVQSTMYGEGYDYAPQYSAMSGDIVGALPVGIKMPGNRDVPFWPATNCWNFKEVWVHPVSRWIWLMRDLAGPAVVEGQSGVGARETVRFRHVGTGRTTDATPDPVTDSFRTVLPEGNYEVQTAGQRKTIDLLPGETYSLDLRRERTLDLTVSSQTRPDGNVVIRATVRGRGKHKLAIRAENLNVALAEAELDLRPESPEAVTWQGRMSVTDAPWVAVIVPDGDLSQKKEVIGSTRD